MLTSSGVEAGRRLCCHHCRRPRRPHHRCRHPLHHPRRRRPHSL